MLDNSVVAIRFLQCPPLGGAARLRLFGFNLHVLGFDLQSLVMNVEAQIRENRHVHIRQPNQREQGDQVASPIRK